MPEQTNVAAPATAADIMRPPLTTIEQEGHVAAAAYLMKHAGATALMVVDAWTDLPVGIITETDIAHAAADGKDANSTRIYELMTTRPTVIKTTTSVCDAAKVMTSAHFRHLPVVGDAGLIGIVDITDVCRALLEPAFPGCPPEWPSQSAVRLRIPPVPSRMEAGVMTQFTHDTAPTQYVEGGGIRFAYRRFGIPGRPPVVFFQHFMGTLDDHDPALSDAFAADREVILFDNAGVASSSGTVPDTIEAMARDAITLIDALGLNTIDVAGHSMGGLVAQEVALARPELVRRLMLVGTGPRGGEGIGALPAWVAELFTRKYERQEDMWLPILFAPTETSQAAGRAYVERIVARPDRDTAVSDQSIAAQGAALAAYGAAKDPRYAHLKGLRLPVLVVNGSDDIVIPTINSYILQQFLPDAELILYPDANHGAHFQYPELFVRHARIFLGG